MRSYIDNGFIVAAGFGVLVASNLFPTNCTTANSSKKVRFCASLVECTELVQIFALRRTRVQSRIVSMLPLEISSRLARDVGVSPTVQSSSQARQVRASG